MEKIKVKQIAEDLGISRVTVWKVMNNIEGVSPKTVRRVKEALNPTDGRIHYTSSTNTQSAKTVTMLAARADTSTFWTGIVDRVASELNQNGIGLNYLPIDVMRVPLPDLESMLQPSRTNGLIVLNVYNPDVLTLLRDTKLPACYLDTIPQYGTDELCGDLILLDGERTVEKITDDMIKKGCKRIGFIGDIGYAKTNLLRFDGFCSSLQKNGLKLEKSICFTDAIGRDTYRDEISAFLNSIENMPDAFVCVNDYVAFLLCNLLSVKVKKLPLVSGYDDSKEFMLDQYKAITVHVQNGIIGKRMVHQLLFRINNPTADYEEIKIYPKVLSRG